VASFNFGPLKSLTDYFSGGSQTPEPALPRRSTVLPRAPRRKSFLDELDDELNQPDELGKQDQQEPDDFLKRLDESLKEPDELPPPKRYTSPFSFEPAQPATSRAAEPFRLPGTTPADTAPFAKAAPQAPFTPMKPVAAVPLPAAAAPGIAPPAIAPSGIAPLGAAPSAAAPAAKQKYPFAQWYTLHALNYGLNPDPDAPGQDYDYRAAYEAGAEPDATGHWPSQFKKPGHANEVVGGFNTITGERVPGTKREGLGWLIEHGWEPATARQLVKLPEPKPTATPTPTSRTGLPQMPADAAAPTAVTPPTDDRTPAQFTSALDRVMKRMADAGHPMRVSSSERTAEQQQKLFAQGRSAPGPIVTEVDGVIKKSLHQQGIAADLAFTGKDKPWDLLGKIAKEEGLVWGGDWKTLKDYGHVQLGTALPASGLAPMKPMAAHEPAVTPAQQAAATPQLPPIAPLMAHEKTKEEAKIGAAPPLDPLGFWDFTKGLFDRDPVTGVPVLSKKGESYIPFAGSVAEAADYADIWRAAVRVRDGKGTPADEKILRDFQERDLDEARRGTSLGYKVASTVAGLVPFAVEFTATGGAYKWGAGVTREGQEALIRTVLKESTEKAGAHVAEQAAVKGVKHEAVEMAKGVVPWLAGSAVQEAASVPRLAAAVGQQLAPDLSEKPLSKEDQQAADQLDAIGGMIDSYKPRIEAANALHADLDTFNQAQQAFAPLDAQMQAAVKAHDATIGALNQEMARSGQALETEQTRFTERVDAWKRRGSPNSEVALINAQQANLNLHIQAFTQRQSEVQQEAAQAQAQLDAVRGPYEQQFAVLKAQGTALEPRIAAATKDEQELSALQKQAEPLQRRLTKAQSRDLHTMLQDYHDDFLPALGKAFGDQFVEIASERTGEAPGEVFALLGKSQLGQRLAGSVIGRAATSATERVAGLKAAVLDRWLRLSPKNTLGRFLDMAAEGTAWSGTIGEIYEERVGDVMRAMQPWLNKPGQAQPPIVRLATGEARPPEQGETAADLAGPRAQALKDLASQISLEGLAFSVPGVIAKVVEAVPLEKVETAIFGKEKPEGFSVEGATLDQLGEMRQGLQVLRQSLTVPAHVEAITDRLAQVDAQIAKLGGPAAVERPAATEPPAAPAGARVPGPEFAPVEPTAPEPTPVAEPTGVGFTVTRDARQQLYDLGYSRPDVDAMNGDAAQAILAAGTVKPAADEQAPKRARLQELREAMLPLAQKGGLTAKEAEHYQALAAEASDLLYDLHDQPPTAEQIGSPEARKSTLSHDVVVTAWQDTRQSRPIYRAVASAAAGARFNATTALDKIVEGNDPAISAEQLYDAYANTRAALRDEFGDTLTLYRAEGKQREKPTMNWATTREFAAQFGDKVIEQQIPVDNVLAVNVGSNGKYHEIVVGEPPVTEQAQPAPAVSAPAVSRTVAKRPSEMTAEELQDLPISDLDKIGTDEPVAPRGEDVRYQIHRPGQQRGSLMYVESVDQTGASWTTKAGQAGRLTKAEVAQVVNTTGDTSKISIRHADDVRVGVPVETVQGYVGQDENDEAIYDPSKAWGQAPPPKATSRPAKSRPVKAVQEEKPHAAEIRKEPKGYQPEHPGDGEGGPPAEAGGRGGAVERPAVPEAPQVEPWQLTRRQFETDPRAQVVAKGHILASKPADIESGKALKGRSKDDLQTLARAVGVGVPATITKAQLGERIQKMVTLRQFLAGTTVDALQGYPRSELLKMTRLANKKKLSYLGRHQLASALITWAQNAQAEGNAARAHALHYEAVRQALKAGETVPEHILKDYPDLVKEFNLGEIDTGLPEASDSIRGRDTAPEDAALEGDRGAGAPGPRPAPGGRTGAGQARPDSLTRHADSAYVNTVLPDAQAQGYAGDLDKLRRIFDDRARSAREVLEDMQDINNKESGAALLAAIRSYGGIRPFTYEVVQGAPTRKLRGEWQTAIDGFRAQGIFGERSIFRDTGHELDFILSRLHQNGEWSRIPDENALEEEILRLARGLDDVNYMEITEGQFLGALRAAGVQSGEPWWQDYDGTMDFNVDELEAPAPTVDTLDTGEAQPRLPGDVGEVRGAETATPEFEAPFTLTSEISTAPDAIERGLFDEAAPPVPPAPETAEQIKDRIMADLGRVPPGSAERREAIVFRSGNQRDAAALRGYIQAGVPVGITALKDNGKPIDGAVRQMVVDYARAGGHVFVDSGVVGNPDIDFDQVMASYAHLAVDVGEEGAKHLYIVAPDMLRQLPDGLWVGDPEKSRALQAQYQEQIRGFIAAGIQVIVPMQIGPDMAQHAIDTIAQFPGLRMGLPSARAAITLERLQELMDTVAYSHGQYIAGVHFLGLSELNKKFDAFAAAVRAALPQADITADASRTSSMMRTGRPVHTEVKARTGARAAELIDAQADADTTEMAGEFFRGNFEAFTPAELKTLADALNISVAQLKKEAGGAGGVQAAVDASGLEDALFQKFHDVAMARMTRQEGPKARTEVIAESQQGPAKSRPPVSLPTKKAAAEEPAPAPPTPPKPQTELERLVAELKARKEREKAQPPKPSDVLYQDDDGTVKPLADDDVLTMVKIIDELRAAGVTDFAEAVTQFHAIYGEGARELDAAVELAWKYRAGEIRKVSDVLPPEQPQPLPRTQPTAATQEPAPPEPEAEAPAAPPAPAPDYSAAREALGNEPLDFGKHKTVLIKDIYVQQPGYVRWLMDTATTPRARLVIDYVQHQPEYLAAQQQTTTTARAALTEDVVNTLKRLRITATTRADGQVQLEGKLFDYKDIFNEENIRAARTSDGTFIRIVPPDKLAVVVDRIKERVSDQRAENRRPYYESDPELSRLRTVADDWPDSHLLGADGGASLRSRRTEELIDRGTKIGIPHFVLDEQKEDVSRINAAYQAGKPLFILASEPGSGKTYVLGGAIRELRAAGAKTFTYVTKSKDLIEQIQHNLKDFDIGDVKFLTYTTLRDVPPEASDVLIFDESHEVKNAKGSVQGKRAADWMAQARFTIASSATPFENPAQAEYLDATHVFDRPFGTEANDYEDAFTRFAKAFGAQIEEFKLPNGRIASRPVWYRTATSDADSAAARQWLTREGGFSSRRIRLPDDQVDTRLVPIQAPTEHAEQYRQFSQAALDLEYTLPSFSKAWIKNTQKRLLEASKVDQGITEARSALHRGRFPIIFVETKAERIYDINDLKEREARYQRDAALAARARAPKPDRADPAYQGRDENGEPNGEGLPPEGIVPVLAHFQELSGQDTIEIPSAESLIQDAFGKNQVAIYTGSVSPEKAKSNLEKWRAGTMPVLVATMAKGGTGLSLHDTVGDHQTTQINVNMPWTATGVVQVSQRSARYGLQGRAELMWIFAENIPMDAVLGRRVGGRMADMGAVIHGERLRGSDEIENADYDDMSFSEIHESLQASGEAAVPFDSESLQRIMGLPENQADSVIALQHAMALEPQRVGGKAVGIRKGGVPREGALQQPELALVRDRWQRTRLVSVTDAALALGNEIPGYIQAVGSFILQQRERLLAGRMTPRDIAKAYLLTLGSIQAQAINLDTFVKKTGLRPTPDFITVENGVEKVRPEEAVAYWMFTPAGQRALDSVEEGRIKDAQWQSLLRVRDAYGANTIRANAFKDAPGVWSLHHMAEAAHAVNDAHGDSAAIGDVVKKLAGIGDGKEGFIKSLLGIGDTPTVDRREVNFWLTGKATTRDLDTVRAQLARDVQNIGLKSRTMGPEVTARIQRQVGRLAERQGMDPTTAAHLIHHMLWDMSAGTETTHTGLMKAMTLAQAGTPLPTASPAFQRFFGDSQVVDVDGNPLRVYHGTRRLDRIGSRFLKGRATSGPMSFFTDNPELASKYALSKPDTSYEQPDDYSGWFQVKVGRNYVPIDRAWYFLTPEQRAKVTELLPQVTHLDKDGKELNDYRQSHDPAQTGLAGRDHWDYEIKQARGNVLRAAVEVWLNSGGIFDSEEDFMRILELGGMPMADVRYESPWKERPGVVPVYLSIQKPLDTSAIPAAVVDALQRASRGRRARGWGSDIFDKNRRDPKGWMDELREDIKTGRNPHAWTSIPDWVTEALKTQGYDGIRDRSGKFTPGESHDVWIPFEPTQIKSALSNRGTYDPRKPNILYQGGRQATLDFGPQTETQAFKGWFKDSMAVDAEDQPLVVYHATPTSFDTFKPGGKDVRVSGPAMWFTSNREEYPAAHHVEGYGGKYKAGTNVMPVYLSVQAPLRVTTRGNAKEIRERFATGSQFPFAFNAEAVANIKKAGYDGVFVWVGEEATGVPDELIVFDPTQIKSAIGNRGTFSPTSPNILYQQDQPFYSRLTRAVEGAKQNKATGAQWKGTVKNAKTGINQDEYVYASVDDLEPGKSYTKQEVLDYLAANDLKVETVSFGGHTEAEIADIGERLDRAGYGLDGDPDSDRVVKLVPVNDQGEFTGPPVAMAIAGDVSLLGDWLATGRPNESVLQDFSDFVNSDLTPPRYAQHTEPGADVGTQREVFLTVGAQPRARITDVRVEPFTNKNGGTDYQSYVNGKPWIVVGSYEGEQGAIARVKHLWRTDHAKPKWKDGHSEYDDVANPIVRVRFNVRSQVSYTIDQINDIGQRIAKAIGAKHPDHIASGSFDVAIRKGAVTAKEAAQYAHAHRFYLNDQTGALDRVMFIEEVQPPSEDEQKKMPPLLVKNWRELGFKWALRHAAEKGYDAVAWTTGEQQAQRYSLERQVTSIHWGPITDGGPAFQKGARQFVVVDPVGMGAIRFNLTADGIVRDNISGRGPTIEGRHVADVLGKEIADRITSTRTGLLSGEGLKIGGEGLKKLYDVDFPRVVNSLPVVKRAGVRVGTRELQFGAGWGQLAQTRRQEGFLDVPAIEMTGDLRQAVLGGQALFQGPKAAVEFQSHGYDALVRALDSPNVSSAVHELAHIARRWLFDAEIPRDQRRGITDQDIMTAAVWSGARVVGGKVFWTEAAEEKFANGFERYLRDGQAPVPELRDLFRTFAQWLKDIYQTIFGTRLDLDISPAMREVYDHLVIRSMTVQPTEPIKGPAVSRPAVSQATAEARGPPSMLFQHDDEPGDTDTKPYGFVTPSATEPTTRKARRAAERTPLVEFEIPEAEARYQKAHGIKAEGAWDKVGRFKEDLVKITRHFPELDPSASPFHAVAQDLLLDYERSGEWAQLRAHNRIAGFVKDLKKNEVDLFARALILPDILQDHEKGLYDGKTGEELPYGLTKDQVAREVERVNAVVAEHPRVQEALTRRAAFVQQLTKELVAKDLLPRSTLDNKAYYHRQVMTYFQPPEPSATAPVVTKGSVRQRKRGFQWTRSGGGDFNTHYIQSEYEWVAQALKELKTKATLEKLKAVFDTSQSLRTLAKERNYERLGVQLATKAGMDAITDGPHFAKEALKPWKREKAHAIEQLLLALSSKEPGRYIVSPGLQSVVDDLAERYTEYLADNIDIAPEDREPFDSNHPQWWALMKDLVQHKTLAAKWAATFMRANIGEEKFIKASLGDAYIDRRSPEDLLSLADPGYSTHQPDPGNLFYRATSIDDKLFDAVVAGSRELSAKDKREVLAMGGPKETWIIPTWLKDTLDRIGAAKTPGALDVPDQVVKKALGYWKQSVLLLPHRVLKYNVNNFTGDADAVLAYAPGIFLRVPQAISFLRSQDTQRHERLVELGVMNAGLSHVELPDVTTLAGFRHLAEESPQQFMVRQLWFGGTYFEKVRGMTEWRENILRVAAYDYILNQVRADKKVYAASNATRVDAMRTAVNDAKAQVEAAKKGTAADRATAAAALTDAQERLAALLARELVGDYRAVSAFTTEMRSRLLPFFSFQEINLRRYVQLFKNAGREEAGLTGLASRFTRTAGTAATGFSLRMAARVGSAWLIKFAMVNLFMGAVSLWNHLLFPDETEEMRRRGRQQLHLMLGRWSDGSIRSVRVEGAFSDFLEWIGSQNYIEDIFALSRGDITGVEKLWEMGKAPVNKIVQSWEPFFKMGAEQIAGKRAFPDAFRATPIRDRGEHLAGLFSLDGLYSRVTGKPQTGNILSVDTATRLLLLNTDPGEAAYYDTRENVIKYLKSKHKEQPGMEPTEKQNALFYYKKALQWDDADAAQRWLLEYRRLAGDKGKLLPRDAAKDAITASIQGAAPLAMLSYERQAEFRKSLSPRDRASLHMAEVWYRRTYGREAIRQKAQ
jgi:hypothetical protein